MELEEHFSKFGSVSQVHLVVDKDTKRSKGRAYILYTLAEFAARYPWVPKFIGLLYILMLGSNDTFELESGALYFDRAVLNI